MDVLSKMEDAPGFTDKQIKYHQSRKGKRPARGIPSEEAFWLPSHDSVRTILGKNSNPFDEFGADWSVTDILQFVFPPEYRKTRTITPALSSTLG